MSVLLIFYVALYYIRPADWVSFLLGTPLLAFAGLIIVFTILFKIISGKIQNIFAGDVERLMLGFIVAICASHVSHGYLGGVTNAFNKFIPSIVGFFLILIVSIDLQRLKSFIICLILFTSFIAYEGIRQFTTGFAHGGLEAFYQQGLSVNGVFEQIPRIRWYGVFNDPNDLGLSFVLVIPFLIEMLLRKKYIIPILSLPLIGLALYYTNSRGSILAALVAISSYFVFRYRSTKGVIIGIILSALLLLAAPGRMQTLSADESSAAGRVEAWFEAYQMLKSNPLFGVGQGMFTDYHTLTAHNSFVLIMAELGVFGLFFFTGLIYYPYNWLWHTLFTSKSEVLSEDDISFVSAVFASFTGVLAAIFFISRSYVLIPYIAIAMAVSVTRLIDNQNSLEYCDTYPKQNHFKNIALLTIGQVIVLNIVVKVLI